MTELKVTLPDRLAREAQEEGLLKPKAIQRLLREAVRRRTAAREIDVARKPRRRGHGAVARAATKVAEPAFARVWDNDEDAAYDRL